MANYIFKRLLLMIPTLFGILLINFAIIQFVPGGPVEQRIAELQGHGSGATARWRTAARCRGIARGEAARASSRGRMVVLCGGFCVFALECAVLIAASLADSMAARSIRGSIIVVVARVCDVGAHVCEAVWCVKSSSLGFWPCLGEIPERVQGGNYDLTRQAKFRIYAWSKEQLNLGNDR